MSIVGVDGPKVGGPSIDLRYCGPHELLCRQTILFSQGDLFQLFFLAALLEHVH